MRLRLQPKNKTTLTLILRLSCLQLRLATFIISFLLVSFSVSAETSTTSASMWLERMQHAVKTLNYDISFVVIPHKKANPWHWLHGQHNGQELEILTSLNGPIQQIVRKGNLVTYIDKQRKAYTVKDSITDSPMPDIIRGDLNKISQSYAFTLVGKSRVAGFKAQLIRVLPKDTARYAFWLWLHEETALPLKTAIVNRKGEILEQIQVANLHILPEVPIALVELEQTELPTVKSIDRQPSTDSFDWQVNWVPSGFSPTKVNRHRLFASEQNVDYLMLSDGLVWFSVYIRRIGENEILLDPNTYMHSGADTYLTQAVGPFEITVIGEIPAETARKLAQSVRLKNNLIPASR